MPRDADVEIASRMEKPVWTSKTSAFSSARVATSSISFSTRDRGIGRGFAGAPSASGSAWACTHSIISSIRGSASANDTPANARRPTTASAAIPALRTASGSSTPACASARNARAAHFSARDAGISVIRNCFQWSRPGRSIVTILVLRTLTPAQGLRLGCQAEAST